MCRRTGGPPVFGVGCSAEWNGWRSRCRIHLLNFDALCSDPTPILKRLLRFVQIYPPEHRIEQLTRLVTPPDTIGRFRLRELDNLDRSDVDYVESLGFDTI